MARKLLRKGRPNRGPRSPSSYSASFDKNAVRRLVIILVASSYLLYIVLRSDGLGTDPINHDPHEEKKNILATILKELTNPETEAPFQASKYNFTNANKIAVPKGSLPAPRLTDQSTVVLVLSSRPNFEVRTAIRESWAKGNDNVYFVIGGAAPDDLEDQDLNNPMSVSSRLKKEQELNEDIIDCIQPDTYKSLPYKVHFGMRWMIQNLKNVQWIVKADDDVVVRVNSLQFFVLRNYNPQNPTVIGRVVVGAPVHREGKWAEDPRYTERTYPPWAYGSSGYIVSRPIAQYLADNELYYYQGEDASLGIWLSESPLQVHFLDTPELYKDRECHEKFYIIGHDLTPNQIRGCFNQVGDEVPERKHIIAFHAGRKDQHPGKISNYT